MLPSPFAHFPQKIYNHETVKKDQPINAIAYYQALLQRYATALIHNKAVAEKLTKDVLNDQYDLDKQEPSAHLRKVLLTDMRNRFFYYQQSIIFDRPLVKVPALR